MHFKFEMTETCKNIRSRNIIEENSQTNFSRSSTSFDYLSAFPYKTKGNREKMNDLSYLNGTICFLTSNCTGIYTAASTLEESFSKT